MTDGVNSIASCEQTFFDMRMCNCIPNVQLPDVQRSCREEWRRRLLEVDEENGHFANSEAFASRTGNLLLHDPSDPWTRIRASTFLLANERGVGGVQE